MILEEKTFEKYGYYPRELKPKSGKKILAACDKCGIVRIITKQHYCACCPKCSRSHGNFVLNRMYRFEDLYSRFLSDLGSWKMVVEEINKKAKHGNPYALNIWRFFNRDFAYTKKVSSAIDLYLDSFKRNH